jgi:hypothetical protein
MSEEQFDSSRHHGFSPGTPVCPFKIFSTQENFPQSWLGTGHKVTARVGWSDLGWAMENLWVVSMGRQFFCMSTVGPPNKNPCMSTSKNKDINNKSKQNYPNYQMQIMLLKQVLCLYNNKKWSNHSKYKQLESSSVS